MPATYNEAPVKRYPFGAAVRQNEAAGPPSHPSMFRFWLYEVEVIIVGAAWYIGCAIDIAHARLRALRRKGERDAHRWPPDGFV